MLAAAWVDGLAGLDRDPDLAPLLFQRPIGRFPVDIATVPRLIALPPVGSTAKFPLFPKLGAKSWRDGGSLCVIEDGVPLQAALTRLLASLTPRQHSYLERIRGLVSGVDLSLYRYVDFTCISEARWTFVNGRARLSSRCLRQLPADQFDLVRDDMHRLVSELGTRLGYNCIIDCTIERCGRVRVLEVNPYSQSAAARPVP